MCRCCRCLGIWIGKAWFATYLLAPQTKHSPLGCHIAFPSSSPFMRKNDRCRPSGGPEWRFRSSSATLTYSKKVADPTFLSFFIESGQVSWHMLSQCCRKTALTPGLQAHLKTASVTSSYVVPSSALSRKEAAVV